VISHFLFYFSLAFDFKGIEDGGSVFQLVLFALTILTAAHIIIKDKIYGISGSRHNLVGILLIIHLVLTFVAALIQGVEIGRYLRVVLPYLFLVLGYFVGVRSFTKFGFDKTLYLLTAASIVASVYTLFYSLVSVDFGNNGIRYQVLSSMLYILVPVLVHRIFIDKKGVKIAAVLMASILILILISATRSWMIVYIVVLVLGFIISRVTSILGLVTSGIRGLFFSAILAAIALPILMFFIPEVISRFGERIFSSEVAGFDVTSATRIAEIDYQLNAWLSDIPSFLIGKGLGASYGFSGESLDQLVYLFGNEVAYIDWWFAGHNFWVYSLFSQGILLGWFIPLLILATLFVTLKNIVSKRIYSVVESCKSISSAVKLCFLVFSSIALSTIGGNILFNRMFAEYIGVFLSLAIVITAPKNIGSDRISRFKSTRNYPNKKFRLRK